MQVLNSKTTFVHNNVEYTVEEITKNGVILRWNDTFTQLFEFAEVEKMLGL